MVGFSVQGSGIRKGNPDKNSGQGTREKSAQEKLDYNIVN